MQPGKVPWGVLPPRLNPNGTPLFCKPLIPKYIATVVATMIVSSINPGSTSTAMGVKTVRVLITQDLYARDCGWIGGEAMSKSEIRANVCRQTTYEAKTSHITCCND